MFTVDGVGAVDVEFDEAVELPVGLEEGAGGVAEVGFVVPGAQCAHVVTAAAQAMTRVMRAGPRNWWMPRWHDVAEVDLSTPNQPSMWVRRE